MPVRSKAPAGPRTRIDEYRGALGIFPRRGSPRALRHAAFGRRAQAAEAALLFGEVLERIGRMPKYVRKVEAEWIALAEKGLKI